MSLKDIKRLLLFAYCGILFIACGNDDKTVGQEELKATVSGKYFLGAEEGTWLKKSGNNLYEIADPYLAGTGPVITGTFWFTDENTLLTPAILSESAMIETSLDFKWRQYLYERGEKITLFVKSNYRYDPSTGRFSTDNQSLVREKGGSSYYIEGISGKEFTLRTSSRSRYTRIWEASGIPTRRIFHPISVPIPPIRCSTLTKKPSLT